MALLDRIRRFHVPGAIQQRPAGAALPVVMAVVAVGVLIAPLRDAEQPLTRVGALLILAGIIEVLHAVRRADVKDVRRGLSSSGFTLLMAFAIIGAPYLAGTAVTIFMAASFGFDGVGYAIAALRGQDRRSRTMSVLAALGDFAVALGLLAVRNVSTTWIVAIAAAIRLLGIAWTMAVTKVHRPEDADDTVYADLALGDHPQAALLRDQVADEERIRDRGNRRVILGFLVILFAIHVARMQPDGSLLGYLAPVVALIGDMTLAVLVTLVVVIPAVVSFRGSTRWIERRVWRWYLSDLDNPGAVVRAVRKLAAWWLKLRMRVGMRLREARYSIPSVLGRGLVTGLPVAAIIAASVPIWGMSWFFDTENWASGIWNSWAESRTDEWRAAMVSAVAGADVANGTMFAVTPPGVTGDFSFIVIGDTGEGDASQQVIRDQLLAVAGRDDVKFVVISSDVVYPNGAMIDYEAKFWLQFKGVHKPVYAIPGNHDWYDALEAFLATFLNEDAARTSMRARAEADLRLTSTSEARIDALIKQAQQLRRDYEVPTGFQRGPFFELQTDQFALVAVDTGVVKRIDDQERVWLEAALDRARGKTIMAVLGHPFYAGGQDEAIGHDEFAALKKVLIDRGATIVMAGDTHDLEYYSDPPSVAGGRQVHHIVNGGGGAYLSFGTALQWPAEPPTAQWAYYPNKDDVTKKINERTPRWKRPAWWWTTYFNAWPFSSEWLSGMFDYNVAPFFQSFFEVRVEPSAGVVRLRPYGIHGPLRWRDLAHSKQMAAAPQADQPVEWVVPMARQQ